MNKIKTEEDHGRFRLALIPVDQAFWASEQKWGVGRLERLVSPTTLASYQRGWTRWREALDEGDATAVERIGPLMVQALAVMDQEVAAAGHAPLAPETWETGLSDGTVLVVVRSGAEASAVLRAARPSRVTAGPGGGLGAATLPGEGALPPDVMLTVRGQHEGRALEVWTLAEVARLIEKHGSVVDRSAARWEGSAAPSGRVLEEGAAADIVRNGYPLEAPLTAPLVPASAPVAVVLDF